MPILNAIQRRSIGGRILIAGMYLLLIFGATWMVYPFLLMLSGSVKSDLDVRHFDIFPKYLRDDETLFAKFEQQRYGILDTFNAVTRYQDAQGYPLFSFEFLKLPSLPSTTVLQDWRDFMVGSRSWPPYFLQLGHGWAQRSVSELGLEYQQLVWKAFPNILRDEIPGYLMPEAWPARNYQKVQGPFAAVYREFRQNLPSRYFIPVSIEGSFIQSLPAKYGIGHDAVKKLNQSWRTQYKSLVDVRMSSVPPTHPIQLEDWWSYVRKDLSYRFIKLSPGLLPDYQIFLRSKYQTISTLNKVYGTSYLQWSSIPFPFPDSAEVIVSDIEAFIESRRVVEGISIDSPDFRWRHFLQAKYGNDLATLNRAHGANYHSFDEVLMPVFAYDWQVMKQNRWRIIGEYLTRNYRVVWSYLTEQGRAIQNTIIFCALNVLTALIINPIAAYALSRFQPRWSYKALFFVMATMAFPGEVTQIPSFLMLREMGLLNTFVALVIPAAANGFLIFLLKGFFDNLPKDLYESATLDGASELRIFATITIPLSTPILAVVALQAFAAAYGAFMFALLVCQKESMWTLMVYIYQLQQFYNAPIVFASLVFAAIPTLLVFVFCQNIIMRGIVIPVEK